MTSACRAEMKPISDSWKAASASVSEEDGDRDAVRPQPFERRPLEFPFHHGVEKLRLRLADLGRVDQGENCARLDGVVDLLEDGRHRSGQARRKMGHAGRVERHFAVGADRVGHGPLADDVDIDARLDRRLLGGELHPPQMKRVVGVVLRPGHEGDRLGRVVLRQAGLAVDLRQLRMVDHALGDAVLPAEAELVRLGQELFVALDADRLGDEMLRTPVVGSRCCAQTPRVRQLPAGVMSDYKHDRQQSEYDHVRDGIDEEPAERVQAVRRSGSRLGHGFLPRESGIVRNGAGRTISGSENA